jgi:hypothetical protein
MFQRVTVGNTNLTISFKPPKGPTGLLLIIKRTGVGVATISGALWPGGIAPSFNASEVAAGTRAPVIDMVGFTFDGANYYGNANMDFR